MVKSHHKTKNWTNTIVRSQKTTLTAESHNHFDVAIGLRSVWMLWSKCVLLIQRQCHESAIVDLIKRSSTGVQGPI